MELFFVCAYPWLFYSLLSFIAIVAWYRFKYYKRIRYRFSRAKELKHKKLISKSYFRTILFLLRLIVLILLALLIAKPQLVDVQSIIQGEGVDIVLVLDVSGSMQCFDDMKDRRQRIEVAKNEAIKFIDKREYDPMGLVIFAKNAVTRCPLTLDKSLLKSLVNTLYLGFIDTDGTVLGKGIVMGVNRLKNSTSMSKVMILLTDGAPTPDDINIRDAVAVAQKYDITIYTVGIGDEQGGYIKDPLWGIRRFPDSVNTQLLKFIADHTGGKFFQARKPQDMQNIYETIDLLEKSSYETTIFAHYYDIFKPFIYAVLLIVAFELLVTSSVWFSI